MNSIKSRLTGFSGTCHLTVDCLKQDEAQVITDLCAVLKNYASYKTATIEEIRHRAQKEYDHVYRMHYEVKRNWFVFYNESVKQTICFTYESSESVGIKDGNFFVKELGWGKFRSTNGYFKQLNSEFLTRAELIAKFN